MNKNVCGIYRIVCTKNGRYIFGSSVNFRKRWGHHLWALRNKCHNNPIVQNCFNKYGEASFCVELTEFLPNATKERLLVVEQKYLDEHIGKPNCMNINSRANSCKDRKCSTETRRKLSEKAKQQWEDGKVSEEFQNSVSGFKKGHIPWSKGLTKETDPRVAEIGKTNSKSLQGNIPWNKGLTKETDDRIVAAAIKESKTQKGRRHPPDCAHCIKIRNQTPWNKGLTKETDGRLKSMSLLMQGKKQSPETIEKLRQKALKQWERKRGCDGS